MTLRTWRNIARFGLLTTGVYLWYGGRLGPATCLFEELQRRFADDGYLEVTVSASGTPTARNLRRQIEHVAGFHGEVDELRIQVIEGSPAEVRRALADHNEEYLLRHRMAMYERHQTGELFIDTHRLEDQDRLPMLELITS